MAQAPIFKEAPISQAITTDPAKPSVQDAPQVSIDEEAAEVAKEAEVLRMSSTLDEILKQTSVAHQFTKLMHRMCQPRNHTGTSLVRLDIIHTDLYYNNGS